MSEPAPSPTDPAPTDLSPTDPAPQGGSPTAAAPSPGPVTLTMDPDPESIDLVHEALSHFWLRRESVPAGDRARFEMGVIEILGNIVEHAFLSGAPIAGRRLQVTLDADEHRLVAVLGDNGLPVAVDLSAVTMPDEDAESGRGLALAVAALDDLTYERVDARNTWTLRCDLATT